MTNIAPEGVMKQGMRLPSQICYQPKPVVLAPTDINSALSFTTKAAMVCPINRSSIGHTWIDSTFPLAVSKVTGTPTLLNVSLITSTSATISLAAPVSTIQTLAVVGWPHQLWNSSNALTLVGSFERSWSRWSHHQFEPTLSARRAI